MTEQELLELTKQEEGYYESPRDSSLQVVFLPKTLSPKEPSSSPKRLLLDFSLSAEEAYEKVVAYLGIRKQVEQVEARVESQQSAPTQKNTDEQSGKNE